MLLATAAGLHRKGAGRSATARSCRRRRGHHSLEVALPHGPKQRRARKPKAELSESRMQSSRCMFVVPFDFQRRRRAKKDAQSGAEKQKERGRSHDSLRGKRRKQKDGAGETSARVGSRPPPLRRDERRRPSSRRLMGIVGLTVACLDGDGAIWRQVLIFSMRPPLLLFRDARGVSSERGRGG